MATPGTDCQIVLDGNGYFVEPHTYAMRRARIRKSTIVKGGQERYVDLGPGKRTWHMILLGLNDLQDYTGQALTVNGRQIREQLRASYEKLLPLSFTDLDGVILSVHFDDYEEQVRDPRTQITTPSYHVAVILVEV